MDLLIWLGIVTLATKIGAVRTIIVSTHQILIFFKL